jgi:hypothetical protein
MAIREELTLGLSGWKTNLDKARSDVRQFHDENRRQARAGGGMMGGALAGAGTNVLASLGLAGGITGISMAVKSALTEADDLADLTLALNESAEALQRVNFAGQQAASIGVDQIAKSMQKLERSLGDVENKAAAKALQNLGLAAADLAAMPLDEKIIAFSEAFQRARETGTGMHDIQTLLGRSAADLVPLFEQGGDALREMFERAPVMADETVQQMARVNDQIDEMIMKTKTWLAEAVGGTVGLGKFVADVVGSTPGEILAFMLDPLSQVDRAMENLADESVSDQQSAIDREEARKKQSEGMAREQEAAARAAAAEKAESDKLAREDKAEEEIVKQRNARIAEREKERLSYESEKFKAMDPEAQARLLHERIAKSIGADLAGSGSGILAGAQALADKGRFGEAAEVLKDRAALDAIAGRMPVGAGSTGAVGSFAGLMDQIFGRGTPEQQLDEMRRANTLADDTNRTLDAILTKMEEPPEVTLFEER